jgi:hypothetical protein
VSLPSCAQVRDRLARIERHITLIALVENHIARVGARLATLEVNENTMTTGAVEAYSFSATASTPFPTTIAEITPAEYALIEERKLPLPRGWSLEKAESFERTKAA